MAEVSEVVEYQPEEPDQIAELERASNFWKVFKCNGQSVNNFDRLILLLSL